MDIQVGVWPPTTQAESKVGRSGFSYLCSVLGGRKPSCKLHLRSKETTAAEEMHVVPGCRLYLGSSLVPGALYPGEMCMATAYPHKGTNSTFFLGLVS